MDQLLNYFNSIHPMPDALVKYLKSANHSRTPQKNELLISNESLNLNFGFIKKGLVRSILLQDGIEFTSHLLKENDILLVKDFFLKLGDKFIDLQALEAADILWITNEDMQDMYLLFPELSRIILKIITENIFSYTMEYQILLSLNPHKRFKRFMANNPGLFPRVPDTHLASYLNMELKEFQILKEIYSS